MTAPPPPQIGSMCNLAAMSAFPPTAAVADRWPSLRLLAKNGNSILSHSTQLRTRGETTKRQKKREIIKKAADAWRRTKLTPLVSRIFEAYFRLIG